jgi:hemerythrin-like metal-binding protein
MDDQHAIIMDTMNELRLALIRSHQQVSADELLNKLIEFTRLHFWSEERLMEQYGFPGLAEHRTEHQRLLRQLQETFSGLHHGETVNISELLFFLHDWFIDHVEGLDQKYGPWLNKHGVH